MLFSWKCHVWQPKIIYINEKRLTMMFLGRLMRSAMVLISLKAFSMARSELLMVRRFWYFELPNSSKLAAPVPCGGREHVFISLCDKSHADSFLMAVHKSEQICIPKTDNQTSCCYSNSEQGTWGLLSQQPPTLPIIVVRSPPLSSGFWASPTLDGSLRAFSLENVLHSEPTSMTRSPTRDV